MARQMRKCIGCTQVDTAPKHIWAVADGTNGGTDVFWHYDCHSTATGCESCTQTVKDSNGAQNDDLVEHLTGERP
jgi:hypothetical protein